MKNENDCEQVMGVLLPRCYFCHKVPERGIRGGIKLKKAFICTCCEKVIVAMEVDAPEYQELLEKLKMVLR